MESKPAQPGRKVGGAKDRFWIPRFWNGMSAAGWARVLMHNHFAIHPRRMVMAALVGGSTAMNASLSGLQTLACGKRIRETELIGPPIFIIGHWRSGTTLLHEYMVRDPRFTYPDTYMCFCPNHFQVSSSWLRPMIGTLLPNKRPIDNMAAGWDRPQEDEFALCNMGVPSPYLSLIFPNRPPMDAEYLDFEGVSEANAEKWKASFLWFLKAITYRTPKRIVLKSPPHTARIRVLLEMFPDAKFVHIHRDPYSLFPSTMNLWARLSKDQGLQVPNDKGREEFVFSTFERMYAAYRRDRDLLKPNQFINVAYDDLVATPVDVLKRTYEQLELDGFTEAEPKLREFAESQREYKKNQFEMDSKTRDAITERWGWYFDEFGYEKAA